MANNNSPFSIGEFLYDPITSWQKIFNPQITINYQPTTNDVDTHVVNRAGSYGKQLGIIIDMIALLKSEIIKKDNNMTGEQKKLVNTFDELASTVKSAAQEYNDGLIKKDLDQIVCRLENVKEKSPKVYQKCIEQLEQLTTA
jgi:hypothetical protein